MKKTLFEKIAELSKELETEQKSNVKNVKSLFDKAARFHSLLDQFIYEYNNIYDYIEFLDRNERYDEINNIDKIVKYYDSIINFIEGINKEYNDLYLNVEHYFDELTNCDTNDEDEEDFNNKEEKEVSNAEKEEYNKVDEEDEEDEEEDEYSECNELAGALKIFFDSLTEEVNNMKSENKKEEEYNKVDEEEYNKIDEEDEYNKLTKSLTKFFDSLTDLMKDTKSENKKEEEVNKNSEKKLDEEKIKKDIDNRKEVLKNSQDLTPLDIAEDLFGELKYPSSEFVKQCLACCQQYEDALNTACYNVANDNNTDRLNYEKFNKMKKELKNKFEELGKIYLFNGEE